MTEPASAPTHPQRRLHPWSWLFVLLQQLRQFVVPLLALLLLGRGDRYQLWSLVGVGVLVLVSVWHYFTYRYRVTGDSIVINSGLLHRSLRQIPFSRIHNVALHQSLLHRLFGVAEVRLESAGGQKPEAEMRVLKLDDARALEALVRRRGTDAAAGDGDAGDDGTLLLALAPAEVLRLGLVSNRGMVVVGAAAAAAWQFDVGVPQLFERWGALLFGYADSHRFDPVDYALVGASLVLGCMFVLRLFSIVLALLQFHGFRLEARGQRLTVERGLLTRLRTSASRRRLQAFTLSEGVLHRLLGRRSLFVDTAVSSEHQQDQRSLRELAPIAAPATCDELVRIVLPDAQWPPAGWRPLHARAWWRLALPGVAFAVLLTIGLGWRFGAWGLCGLLWLPWAAFVARRHAERAGYACDESVIAVRGGWWSRHWRFAELDKLQALQLRRSPLDRRFGMASLWLDTAGAGPLAEPLRMRYLPEAEARALHARLAREIARRPLRW